MATAKEIFTQMNEQIKKQAEKAKAVNAIYLFDLSGDGGGKWTVNLKDNLGVAEGEAGTPGCTLTLAATDFVNLVEGKANGQMLFMSGKLKVKGDMSLAMKLQQALAVMKQG